MLYTEINNEIQAYVYTKNANKLITAAINFKTKLSVPELALLYRLKVDAGILQADNKTALMQQVAQLYEIPGGSRSYQHLISKYYKIDVSTINSMKTHLITMLNLLRELEK
jgi:hypothetical protein